MTFNKYNCSWVGIDAGREGLWKEPIWKNVLRIIADHDGEGVYDRASPIYQDLEKNFPDEAWRSQTAEGHFRPLFRDYPNSWTRTGVVSLKEQRFKVTDLGRRVLAGTISKPELLLTMFQNHTEESGPQGSSEKPFAILASGILEAPRTLTTDEIYWAIMKNYRPGQDTLANVLKKKLPLIRSLPEKTPCRRLRNMLTLMRTAGVLASTRRGTERFWSALEVQLLNKISRSLTT
jgi:hypothetical protein